MSIKQCVTCGKEFYVKPCLLDRTKYCSRICRKKQVTKVCPICNKTFHVGLASKERRIYCSYACRNEAQWGKDCREINWHCPVCGKGMHLTPFWLKRKSTCSLDCRNKNYSIVRRGENNNLWKGGVKLIQRYIRSSKTMQHWSEQVMANYDGKCAECGEPADHAHHIKTISELLAIIFDPANGIALCEKHHSLKPNHNTNLVRRPLNLNK